MLPLTEPWWSEEEAPFWERFEDAFVLLQMQKNWDNAAATRRLVRSNAGQHLLTSLRRHVARTEGDDPLTLAVAARRLENRVD